MSLRLSRRRLWLLVGLLLLAFALRMYRLADQSIWWDEGISLHLATSSLGEIIRDRLNNIHPPLYFVILKEWLALVGVSAFTARYLSVLASFGQVALAFAAVRYWSRRPFGTHSLWPWLAVGFVLLSPLSVIYGQEIRVYAMLPLAYLSMLLLAEKLLAGEKLQTRVLFYLAVAEWIGLHLHYVAIFGVVYVTAWGIVALVRQRDSTGLSRWVVTQTLVALASLPWLIAVLDNWTAVQAEANAGTFTTEPVPLPYLFSQVWAFHLTGLAGALSSPVVMVATALAAVLVIGLFVARVLLVGGGRFSDGGLRSVAVRMASHWLVPLALALLVWSIRSFSHPRYVVMFAVMFIPLATLLIYCARRPLERAAALALTTCLIGLSIWGLWRYFFDSDTAKPDMRGVARYLESRTRPGDLILIPDTDWSFPFEYEGAADVLMPSLGESPDNVNSTLVRALDCTDAPCAQSGRVFAVDYPRGTRDWQNRLPFELERRGTWLEETSFDDLSVREYQISERAGPLPACDSTALVQPAARFGPMRLDSVWVEQGAAADTAVAVAACWHVIDPASEGFTASLVLRDPVTGERITQSDTVLVNSVGAPVQYWNPGESVITYHLLPLPPGTPPVPASLAIGAYAVGAKGNALLDASDDSGNSLGQLLSLGDVSLSMPLGRTSSPYEVTPPTRWVEPVQVADGLELQGAVLNPAPHRPGQTIRVGLTWGSSAGQMPDLRPVLVLEQRSITLAENGEAPVNGRYPTDLWSPGETVFEYRDIRVPAGAEGLAQLAIIFDDRRVELGDVMIEGAAVSFDKPEVGAPVDVTFAEDLALIGFDLLQETVDPSMTVPLTLYWESLSGEIDDSYTVFTHLLGEDGRLLAQHDSPPVNGARPTNEWLSGEFIIDPHELTWRETGYTGPAHIAIGLYDPATGKRLVTAEGEDHFLLPVTITVEQTE